VFSPALRVAPRSASLQYATVWNRDAFQAAGGRSVFGLDACAHKTKSAAGAALERSQPIVAQNLGVKRFRAARARPAALAQEPQLD
jgi:hypothetical protein